MPGCNGRDRGFVPCHESGPTSTCGATVTRRLLRPERICMEETASAVLRFACESMRATQVNTREDPARDRPPSGALGAQAPIVVLEPDAAKAARPVLRGGWVSNDLSLPDSASATHGIPCARDA